MNRHGNESEENNVWIQTQTADAGCLIDFKKKKCLHYIKLFQFKQCFENMF